MDLEAENFEQALGRLARLCLVVPERGHESGRGLAMIVHLRRIVCIDLVCLCCYKSKARNSACGAHLPLCASSAWDVFATSLLSSATLSTWKQRHRSPIWSFSLIEQPLDFDAQAATPMAG